MLKSFLFEKRFYLLLFFLAGVFLDVFIISVSYNLFTLFLLLLWIITAHNFEFIRQTLAWWFLFTLMLVPIFLIIFGEELAEKIAIWALLFFLTSTVNTGIILRKEKMYE